MKVEEPDLREESSSSLQSFDDASSVLYDNETPEAFDDSGGGDESSTGDDVGSSTAMKDRSYYHLKPSARQFMGGVRTIEFVGSKCYRKSIVYRNAIDASPVMPTSLKRFFGSTYALPSRSTSAQMHCLYEIVSSFSVLSFAYENAYHGSSPFLPDLWSMVQVTQFPYRP
ncbi:hypothetical protein KIN20_014283 [Parelaphostrongylus tenuis]|uniref:Uncharacterized protein n=1 Tax=Parelaphostrongylus tenuis TaxID=148309 RepID=A0AAD5MI46_PARTN|nr:hypothetical protein KIN20_014283 [Parelaphostrongylus tenuis]